MRKYGVSSGHCVLKLTVDTSRTHSKRATRVSPRHIITALSIVFNDDIVLRINASDEDTVHAKIFLLLQTEQYETALAVLDSLNTNGAREFEKAYALYRLHRESEATKVLAQLKLNNSSEAVDRGINHLEAQLVCTRLPRLTCECLLKRMFDQ